MKAWLIMYIVLISDRRPTSTERPGHAKTYVHSSSPSQAVSEILVVTLSKAIAGGNFYQIPKWRHHATTVVQCPYTSV